MDTFYTNERNVQIVISLLKYYKIRKIIASPGTTNITFVASIQQDPFFQIYSSVDERSAAYLACGLSAESGEPVVLSCTGATASRNYLSGLTEAFYRKLPILAITSTQDISRVGQLIPQVIDRSTHPRDVVRYSIHIPIVKDDADEQACKINVNKALLELRRNGGGPVQINLTTSYSRDFSIKQLPYVQPIQRIEIDEEFPDLSIGKRVGIFVGSHTKWSIEDTKLVDDFCSLYDAVVFCDHTSNYKGKYRILYSLIASQALYSSETNKVDVLIHLGEVSGAYYSINAKEVWRVNSDGEIRNTFYNLRFVFDMSEGSFFKHFIKGIDIVRNSYIEKCKTEYENIYRNIPDLPFSNIWIAKQVAPKLPEKSVLHLGILNTLRSWNFFEIPNSVLSYSNVGGFGIDGDVSALIGASLFDNNKLYFGVFGDLAFFYDLNVLGNRHIGNNVRILLINNGKGTEFRNFNHPGARFGEEADMYIAAGGHFGNKSLNLIQHYSEDLGFEYISASNKEEFMHVYEKFINHSITNRPILFEVFTNNEDESNALKLIHNSSKTTKNLIKEGVKQLLGEKGFYFVKKILNK